MRTVDLARLAGLSTQQIRNYEAAGVLPPAVRTGSGHRTFTDRHRRALLTYRALREGYGSLPATRIMRAVHDGDVPGALALVDEVHAGLHADREALRATLAAVAALERGPSRAAPGPDPRGLRIGEAAALVGVRASALRVWEAAGLLVPGRERGTGYRVYGAAETRDARVIHALRRSGHLFAGIRPVVEALRAEGSTDAVREALAARAAVLDARTRATLTGAGALGAYLGGPD
ncbi:MULTISPECIES: MerR family transcriptional regulator [unclassified Streptomyces]|uniref:MerR family transcriptional regulator n=1 Tax=unclassified Streptomyces TaxID=2593676 RepID=UPI00380F332B